MAERIDIAAKMEGVARALLGEPVERNRKGREWRYGRKGSMCINLEKGTFFDHEAGEGGGVLDLIIRERGGGVPDALEWLQGELGEYVPTVAPVSKADYEREQSNLRDYALSLWSRAIDARGTLVEAYLTNRRVGFGARFPDIRFLADCPFGKGVREPCMVALVREPGSGRPMGIHRTALSPDGRKIGRKMLGPCFGGVVKLARADMDSDLAIAEGIETALSVEKLFKRPVWATLTSGGMAHFAPLGGVDSLAIYADNDHAGTSAAQDCARLWMGERIPVSVETPVMDGFDYNDALAALERGELG